MKKIALLGFAAIISNVAANSQTAQPNEMAFRIKAEAFNNSQIEPIAQYMTDFLGSRLEASKMKLRAEDLVMAELDSIGLKNSKVEFAYEFEKGGWDNERNYVAMTAPYYCSFAANPKAWSGSTDGEVKGECVLFEATDVEGLEKYKGQLNGKIVLMPQRGEYELSFEPEATRYTKEELQEMKADPRGVSRKGRYRWDPSRMKLQAAVDSFFREERPLAVISGDGVFNVPGSRGVRYKSGDPQPVPEIILPVEDHGRMVRLVKNGIPVEMEIDIRNTFTDNQQINNVIVEIPGTDPKLKNEVVLLGAHLDSWHGGTGAADDAAGCITMMEALRILNDLGVKPRRTIRLALWGGEEQGLYGSRGYAKNRLYDSEKGEKKPEFDNFVLYLNNDFGGGRYRGIYLEENDMAFPFFEVWKKPLESLGFETLSPQRTGSTDHVSFNSIGLPAYQFIQDPLDYFRTYHSTMDTYERLPLDDMRVNAAIVAWLAYSAAMDDNRIPVKPGFPQKQERRMPW